MGNPFIKVLACGYRKVDPREILHVLSELGRPGSLPMSRQNHPREVDLHGKKP